MPTPRVSDKVLSRTIKVLNECGGSYSQAAQRLGIGATTAKRHAKVAAERGLMATPPPEPAPDPTQVIEFPDFPDEELPDDELVALMTKQSSGNLGGYWHDREGAV